jgi:hypothetical protein
MYRHFDAPLTFIIHSIDVFNVYVSFVGTRTHACTNMSCMHAHTIGWSVCLVSKGLPHVHAHHRNSCMHAYIHTYIQSDGDEGDDMSGSNGSLCSDNVEAGSSEYDTSMYPSNCDTTSEASGSGMHTYIHVFWCVVHTCIHGNGTVGHCSCSSEYHTRMCACMYVCMYPQAVTLQARLQASHFYTRVCVCIYIYIVYVYMYIYIYTPTYACVYHTQSLRVPSPQSSSIFPHRKAPQFSLCVLHIYIHAYAH